MVDFGSSAVLMAESPKTPNKGGRSKTKRGRLDHIRGFDCHPDVYDFVRGAIWVLHTQDLSLRDIAAAEAFAQRLLVSS